MSSSALIFGGTFDPPHRAHTELPPLAAAALGCSRLIYVPTSANPLKDDTPTAAEHRLAMLRLALAETPEAEINTVELDREGPSYTVETLESLRRTLGESVELRLLIGADAALSFDRWRDPHRILKLATPAVLLRPPWDESRFRARLADRLPAVDVDRWSTWTVPVTRLDVNATELRRRLHRGDDVSDWVDADVMAYIREHGLYGTVRT